MSGLHEGGFERILGLEGAELGLGRFYITIPFLCGSASRSPEITVFRQKCAIGSNSAFVHSIC
jgi:hypothetical protein